MGPTEEDEAYAAECEGLVSSMGMENNVKYALSRGGHSFVAPGNSNSHASEWSREL